MLIEFSVKNYLSFRDQAALSLVKANSTELDVFNAFESNALATPALLNSSVIYGANAAGKSNLIKALRLMRGLVLNSARESQADEQLLVTPFLLNESSKKQPSEFEVSFVSENVRYQYGFIADNEKILSEWLYAYPEGRPQRWIDRSYDVESDTYQWGTMGKLLGKKRLWQEATRPNALFLSTAIQLNNQQLKPVFEWFSNILHVAGFGKWSKSFSVNLCDTNEDSKADVLNFIKAADISISDLEIEKEKFELNHLSDDIPNDIRKRLEKDFKDKSIFKVKTGHIAEDGQMTYFNLDDESDGTQKIFALSGPWLDTLKKGHVLVIDELHDNLHPLMVKFLVELFHNKDINQNHAQLIFTTHETSILNQEVFRRDQIWFCEKDKNQASSLYPLTDFSTRKGADNLEKGYLSGRYGALPYFRSINDNMEC